MTASFPAGVLFDVDGTLCDTTYLHTVSWWQAFRQHNHDVPMARIHRAIGMGSDKLLDHVLGQDRDRSGDAALADGHDTLFATYWQRLGPLPGASDLVRTCLRGPSRPAGVVRRIPVGGARLTGAEVGRTAVEPAASHPPAES